MKKIIAANWKLFKSPSETEVFLQELLKHKLLSCLDEVEVLIFPSALSVDRALQFIKKYKLNIQVGVQNISNKEDGAWTGENSILFGKDLGAQFVLIGHSERRQYFQETDNLVRDKILLCQKHQLTPMVCIGETLQQRDQGQTWSVLQSQLQTALQGANSASSVVIAYEPVWAIGTGRVAEVAQVQEVHALIKNWLKQQGFGTSQVLYGGSVKPENAQSLAQCKDVDGFLIGGASLQVESLISIISAATS